MIRLLHCCPVVGTVERMKHLRPGMERRTDSEEYEEGRKEGREGKGDGMNRKRSKNKSTKKTEMKRL